MPTKHQTAVRNYDDVFLTCRDLRHVWRLVGYYRDNGAVRRLLDCERCGTQRNDRWSQSGERIASSYNYAEQYRMEGGMDAVEVRREAMHRATIYTSEDQMIHALTAGGRPQARGSRGRNVA